MNFLTEYRPSGRLYVFLLFCSRGKPWGLWVKFREQCFNFIQRKSQRSWEHHDVAVTAGVTCVHTVTPEASVPRALQGETS